MQRAHGFGMAIADTNNLVQESIYITSSGVSRCHWDLDIHGVSQIRIGLYQWPQVFPLENNRIGYGMNKRHIIRRSLAEKIAVVLEWIEFNIALEEICWEHSLSGKTLKRWKMELEKHGYLSRGTTASRHKITVKKKS